MSSEQAGAEARSFAVPCVVQQGHVTQGLIAMQVSTRPAAMYLVSRGLREVVAQEQHPLKVQQVPKHVQLQPLHATVLSLLLLLHDILLSLLQKSIDLVLKAKAELDGAQAEAVGFCEVAFGPVGFAKRLRSLDFGRRLRLQQEVDKLREMIDICSANLSDCDTSRSQLETCTSRRIEELGHQLTEEESLHKCHNEFAVKEASFGRLIQGLAEGYPIMLDSWLHAH